MKQFLIILLLVIAGALIIPLTVNLSSKADDDPLGLKGKPAPTVSLKTLNGQSVDLSQLKGKVVLLDVWATWCPPCRESLPHLQHLSTDSTRAAQGLLVYAVNDAEKTDDISAFLTANHYTFPVALGDDPALQALHVQVLPSTLLIGRDGKVKATFTGYYPTLAPEIDSAIDTALAEK